MNPPKNRHSEPRNSHIAELGVGDAGVGRRARAPCAVTGVVGARARRVRRRRSASARVRHRRSVRLGRPGSMRPAVDAERAATSTPATASHEFLNIDAVADDRQPERDDQRPVRRRRHVDAVPASARRPSSCRRPSSASSATAAPSAAGTQAALVVLGVLAVPELVEARRRSGISAKLYSGGGDGIVHSSVRASHGSCAATLAAPASSRSR